MSGGPAVRSSLASMMPPGAPIGRSACLTCAVGEANGGRAKSRPKRSGRTRVFTTGGGGGDGAAACARAGASALPAITVAAVPSSPRRLIGHPDCCDIWLLLLRDGATGAHWTRASLRGCVCREHPPEGENQPAGGWSIRTMLPEGSRTAKSRVPQN